MIAAAAPAAAAAALVVAAASGSAPQVSGLLPADAGQVSAFAFDPSSRGIVYVGTIPGPNKGRVYKSTDGGEHWRLISGRGWTWLGALAADPRHRGTLYAGTGNAVYKTTDGGQRWRAFSRGLLPPPGVNRGEGWVRWLAVDPTDSNVLYEHDYANTIRKSVDGGRSWRPVGSLWKEGGVAGLLMAPGRPRSLYGAFYFSRGTEPGVYVYATTDGGKTWRKTRLKATEAASVAFAADRGRRTIYIALGARVFSSANGGRNWNFIGLLPR